MLKKSTLTVTAKDCPDQWFLVDAKDQVLGRLVSKLTSLLLGKNSPTYSPHLSSRNFVVIINCQDVKVTGKKEKEKAYYYYSGYPSGLRKEILQDLRIKKPEEIIKHALRGMLPKNRLGKEIISHVYIYPDNKYPHEAQKPVKLEI